MGYSTDFNGEFSVTPTLTDKHRTFLEKFNQTRRMKRDLDPEFGIEGELYVDGDGIYGQANSADVINFNSPPRTQPGLWCQWAPNEDGTAIEWDGGEKFYNYVEWIEYLIEKILAPAGYKLNGEIEWIGEDADDRGKIIVKDNVVSTKNAQINWV